MAIKANKLLKQLPMIALATAVFGSVAFSYVASATTMQKINFENKNKQSIYPTRLMDNNQILRSTARLASGDLDTPKKQVNTDANTAMEKLSNLGIQFVPNKGQVDASVRYLAKTFAGTVFVTDKGELVYSLPARNQSGTPKQSSRVRPAHPSNSSPLYISESLIGSSLKQIEPLQPSSGRVNYFLGRDPSRWITGVTSYSELSLGEVYSGIELRLKAHSNNIEKLFYVSPGADLSEIQIQLSGVNGLSINQEKMLVVATDKGEVTFSSPFAWQEIDGAQKEVEVAYSLSDKGNIYSFIVAGYDDKYPLVIDPILQSTFLGGGNSDQINDIGISSNGNVYVTGVTSSSDFPKCSLGTCILAADNQYAGPTEAFVAFFNPELTTLYQTTYFGGSASDEATSLVIEKTTGDIYVTGKTYSYNMPICAGIGGECESGADITNAGKGDAFVARFNAGLNILYQSTYLGGSELDESKDIITSDSLLPVIYIVGNTFSNDFTPPDSMGVYPYKGNSDVFIAGLSQDLRALGFFAYIGTTGIDEGNAIHINSDSSQVYVSGYTNSSSFPMCYHNMGPGWCIGGADQTFAGGGEGFVSLFDRTLKHIRSTYIGGSWFDTALGLAVSSGTNPDIYVTGETGSPDFPSLSGGADTSAGGFSEAFVSKLNNSLLEIKQSTYIGGTGQDIGINIVISPGGDIYVFGSTSAPDNFPAISNGADTSFGNSSSEAYISLINNELTSFVQSTFLGGNGLEYPGGIALGNNQEVYVTGSTGSSDFPMTFGGADSTILPLTGEVDAEGFVSRLDRLLSGFDNEQYYIIPLKNRKTAIFNLD